MGKEKRSRRYKDSSGTSDSESSSSESDAERKLRKLKKKLKKEQRKAEKLLRRKLREEKRKLKKKYKKSKREEDIHEGIVNEAKAESEGDGAIADVPIGLMERSKAWAPMTKEEWDKRQSIVRRVLDEESGRYRLIKGDGEVLEEIVSLQRHREINAQATKADGDFFQKQTTQKGRIT